MKIIEEFKEEDALEIAKVLRGAMGVKHHHLCFCGSLRKYSKCCYKHGVSLNKKAVIAGLRYTDSQGVMDSISGNIWSSFYDFSSNRIKCLFPYCSKSTSECHLVSNNTIKSLIGKSCWFVPYKNGKEYISRSSKKANCLPVFCSDHDDELFKKIDTYELVKGSFEDQFLYGLKNVAFELRKAQILLNINYQVALYEPAIYLHQNPQLQGIDRLRITFVVNQEFKNSYIRYKSLYDFYIKLIRIYETKNYDHLMYLKLDHKFKRSIAFGSVMNPLQYHDGSKVLNPPTKPIGLSLSIFGNVNDGGCVYVMILPGSEIYYQRFVSDLKNLSEHQMNIYLGKLMHLSANFPILNEKRDLIRVLDVLV